MKLLASIHEWAADRFSFIQYPNLRGPKPQFFEYQMPTMTRVFIALFSGGTLIVTTLLLIAFLVLIYSILTT